MRSQQTPTVSAAAVALVAAAAGAVYIAATRDGTALRKAAAPTAIGLAGALLTGLLPSGAGWSGGLGVVLIGLGMELRRRWRGCRIIVLLAANLAFLLAGKLSVADMAWP